MTRLMAGVIATITLSGRSISRTGRYRAYPVVGTALAAVGLALLGLVRPGTRGPGSDRGTAADRPRDRAGHAGHGAGRAERRAHADLGATTSAVTFLRQIGASAGVAVVGALITARFTDRLPAGLADRLPGGVGALSAGGLAALPPDRGAVAAAFGEAAPPVFGYVAPLLGVAFLLALALPPGRCATPRTPTPVHRYHGAGRHTEEQIMADTLTRPTSCASLG